MRGQEKRYRILRSPKILSSDVRRSRNVKKLPSDLLTFCFNRAKSAPLQPILYETISGWLETRTFACAN